MHWDTLHEAVRSAVEHREDWPLPICIVAEWSPEGRSVAPGRFRPVPGDAPEASARQAILRLEQPDLMLLVEQAEDFLALDEVLDELIAWQARRERP
jgi:hypothetical protein